MLLTGILLGQLWMSLPDSTAILNGSWQSCQDDAGQYGERVYDYHVNGKLLWSFHMGPRDDFALFKAGTELEPDWHDTPFNLLDSTVAAGPNGKRSWTIKSLKLKVSVVQAGGSRDECQSWIIRIERIK